MKADQEQICMLLIVMEFAIDLNDIYFYCKNSSVHVRNVVFLILCCGITLKRGISIVKTDYMATYLSITRYLE